MKSPRWEDREKIIKGILDGSRALSGPEHVVIDLTNRCSNRCIACWTRSPLLKDTGPDRAWHSQELPRSSVDTLIDDLGSLGTVNIQFSGGGDPLLYPDIAGVVQRVKSRGIYCALTTGLPGSTAELLQDLFKAGLDELAVSLWASDGPTYAATHPGQTAASFDLITRSLKKAAKPPGWFRRLLERDRVQGSASLLNFLNVICSLNYDKVESMYNYALGNGADSIYFTLVDTIEGCTDDLLLSRDQRAAVKDACDRIKGRNDSLPPEKRLILDGFDGFFRRLSEDSAHNGRYDEAVVSETPCYVGWIFCRIMADGGVAPCCRGVNIPMGNINEQPFRDIWYSGKYDSFRKAALNFMDDPTVAENIGCAKTCDNHVHNDDIHRMMKWVADGSFPGTLDNRS